MGAKTYTFPHALGREEAMKRAAPMAENIARKYMMTSTTTDTGFLMSGKGTKATVLVTDTSVEITMELPFLIEKIAGNQIEAELNYKVPKALA
jgi:hypothetical protein